MAAVGTFRCRNWFARSLKSMQRNLAKRGLACRHAAQDSNEQASSFFVNFASDFT